MRRDDAAVLTVNHDLDHLQIDLPPGIDARLAGIHSLVRLLDSADLQVVVRQDTEPD